MEADLSVFEALVKFILPNAVFASVLTDINGEFEVELGTFTEEVNATLEVTAVGYELFTNSGPIDPDEDVVVNV